jgi:hypothetical protein
MNALVVDLQQVLQNSCGIPWDRYAVPLTCKACAQDANISWWDCHIRQGHAVCQADASVHAGLCLFPAHLTH